MRRLVVGGVSLMAGLAGALVVYRMVRRDRSRVELSLEECGPRVYVELFGWSFHGHLCEDAHADDGGGEELEHDPEVEEPEVEIIYEYADETGDMPPLPRPVVPEA